jgi:Zn-dependent peptidase ImmA (M78 family)
MPIDLQQFAGKLKKYRDQLQLSLDEVSAGTGIELGRLVGFEEAATTPTGDEILILADFYRCDYRFFISNEKLAPFEQTEQLYRRFGDEFSRDDRSRIQEFLFLSACEEALMRMLNRPRQPFEYHPQGNYFKGHAADAAAKLRAHFGYSDSVVPLDVYSDFRKIGIHVFRRRLDNSNISGLTLRHPAAGPSILVNYSEDIYRQRFTAAHEAAHAILDKEDVVVSFSEWKGKDLVEIRANTFASRYLLPPEVLDRLPVRAWTGAELSRWAAKLRVSVQALAIGLKENGLIDDATLVTVSRARGDGNEKVDPELEGLAPRSVERKRMLMERGLSHFYVSLCFDAVAEGLITNAKAAEMLMVTEGELSDLAEMYNVKLIVHG